MVLFRPPYEGRTAAVDGEAKSLGMLQVLWNVDSGDSLGANYAGIERNVIAGLRPGASPVFKRARTVRSVPSPSPHSASRRTVSPKVWAPSG